MPVPLCSGAWLLLRVAAVADVCANGVPLYELVCCCVNWYDRLLGVLQFCCLLCLSEYPLPVEVHVRNST